MLEKGQVAKWESQLWDYVSSGDAVRCPIYTRCHNRRRGNWCPSDNLDNISQLLDDVKFDASKYDSVGGGECGMVFHLVERLAQSVVKKGKVHCPPVPAELVFLADKQHTIEIRLVPLTVHHGAIWRLKDSWIIQLNGNDTPARRRFTLFHETFHILAHRGGTPVFKKRDCEAGCFNELLADYFAGCILMPGKWVEEKWAKVNNLRRMAATFDVEESLMWARLREMGLI